jgi:hypothetical protein
VNACEEAVLSLPRSDIEGLQDLVTRTAAVFPNENTWAQSTCGVHSLVVRVDHVGGMKVCEVEPRPAGMGVVAGVLPHTAGLEMLAARNAAWGDIDVIVAVSPERLGRIDDLDAGFRVVSTEEALHLHVPMLVRCQPNERSVYPLIRHAIAPVRFEQHKGYGVTLGLWKPVAHVEVAQLLGGNLPVVIKSDGARSESVCIWHPGDDCAAFLAQVSKLSPLYYQPFYEHVACPFATITEHGITRPWHTLFRSFFVYSPARKRYLPAASCWVATPTLPVHGTDHMIIGPVVIS